MRQVARPALRGALLAAVVAVTAACGSGTSTTTGRVSDRDGRLCLQTSKDNGTCFGIDDALLSTVQTGECVRVDFSGGGSGSSPTATAVKPSATGCLPARSTGSG